MILPQQTWGIFVKSFLKVVGAGLFVLLLAGCATSRSVVTLNQPQVKEQAPTQSVAIRLDNVTDARAFDPAPPNPNTPSLASDSIDDTALRARAIGRKRNTYGKALGDIMLPENSSVTDVVGSAVAVGFRNAGYRVLNKGDAGFDQAVPVTVRIDQFWCWLEPGFWQISLHNESQVKLSGDLPQLQPKLEVQATANLSSGAAFESDWQAAASQGLSALATNISDALQQSKPTAAARPAAVPGS